MCGCEKHDQYDNFEHYDLTNYDTSNSYTYVDDNNLKYEYVVTDITPEASEEIINGLSLLNKTHLTYNNFYGNCIFKKC